MRAPVRLALALAVGLGSAVALAGDADPVEAAKKVRAAFPAPSEKVAFRADFDFLMGTTLAGQGTLSASPATVDGKPTWETSFRLEIHTEDDTDQAIQTTGSLGADLSLVKARLWSKDRDGVQETSVARKGAALEVAFKVGDDAPELKTIDVEGDVVATDPAATVLFLRQCPEKPATYQVSAFDSDQRIVAKRTLQVKGPVRLKEDALGLDLDTLWALASGGKTSVEVFLSPEDRSFVAMKLVEPNFWLVKKGLLPKKAAEPVPDLSKPAASAREAGVRFAMGILVGSKDAIVAAVDWAAYAERTKARTKEDKTPEAVQAEFLEAVKASMKDLKPEAAWLRAKPAMDAAKETEADGVTTVQFGPPMEGFLFVAKKVGDGWKVVDFPPAK